MKFGPVKTNDALGAILAHSVAFSEGRRLRKGRVLSSDDLTALQASGVQDVIVAQLDPSDVAENEAAERLAAALVPSEQRAHVTLTKPFTGRVNILADGPGVAVINADAINAANAVHPMITIATVHPHHQMADRGMLATIKIISYGVPNDALEQACRAAREAISLATPRPLSAQLIVTEIAGGPGDTGWRAIEERLTALSVMLPAPVRVPHNVTDLAKELAAGQSDLVMVLTGSATSDENDVAPSAVRRAGGHVDRFGMPVDPGNLLFVGSLNGRHVVGLPGCARSPALNGVDWVLSRLICGIEVSSADIAGMGVGGLLKEIPSRPQPRRAP